jgi:hypothetical protein
MSDIKVIQLNNYVKPKIEEVRGKDWVLNGKDNSYFQYVEDRYIGSPTNSTIINGYRNLYFGRGLYARDAARKPMDYAKMLAAIPKRDMRKVIKDYALQFNAAFQIITNKNGTKQAKYIDVTKLAFNKVNEDGEVDGFWYSEEWKNVKKYEPKFIPKYGTTNGKETEILYINDAQDSASYYSLPKYQSGLQYAEMEEEISNYYINHIKNGFSYGYIVNMNNGVPASEEQREEIERRIKMQMTGSTNAGKIIISFNDGKEAAVEIVPLQVSDSHKQWESVNKQGEEKIMRAHGVVSPVLFGIKDNSGLGNNADELQTALSLTMDMRINPEQDLIIDSITPFLQEQGINLDLYFEALNKKEEQEEMMDAPVETTTLSEQEPDGSAFLIGLGEVMGDEWELISEEAIRGIPVDINLASPIANSPATKSDQDNELFKVRFVYKGNPSPQREFCKAMMSAKLVYRKEDIDAASEKVIQAGMGPNGSNKYNIFLYKGGVRCKHFWERRVYLRRNNERISVNEARRRILALDPSDRADFRLPEYSTKVASIASQSNNFWKLR